MKGLVFLTLLGLVGWVNYDNLVEAYGQGPPYYGRTTNMDKWASPLPGLAVIDSLALLGAWGLWLHGSRRRATGSPADSAGPASS